MPERYEPTPEELAKGDASLTPTQRSASEKQGRLLEKGPIVIESNDHEPSDEDRARWPEYDKIKRLSIALQDGRKIELAAAAVQRPAPDRGSMVAPAKGFHDEELFAGTINGGEIPSGVARELFKKYFTNNTLSSDEYYKDEGKIKEELSGDYSLWEDLI